MKALISSLSSILLLSIISISFQSLAANTPPQEKIVPMTQVFMPEKFNNGEEVYAVVSGLFPNGCYSFQRSEVKFDPRENVHMIKSVALVYQGMCISVIVPFSQQVRFGKLGPGYHNFQFINGDGTFINKRVVVE